MIRIFAFFAVVGVMAWGLDLLITSGLRKIGTSKFGSMNRMVDGRVNADVVINGSSRALCHYDPRVISSVTSLSAYNIGMNASQIDFQLAVLQCYLRNNSAPRIVIQNLDPFSFETTKRGNIYDPGYYVPYLDEPDLYEFLRSIEPDVWKWRHIPLYGYTVEDMRFTWIWGLLAWVNFKVPEDYFLGFNPRRGNWNEDFDQFRQANTNGVRNPIEPGGIQAVQSIMDLCRESSIELILVFSPEYIEMQQLDRTRAEVFSRFQNMADAARVRFWDYSSSYISRSKEYFNNSQHLNARGAAEFSAEVARRINREVLSRSGPQSVEAR